MKLATLALMLAAFAVAAPQAAIAQEVVGADVPATAEAGEVPAGETEPAAPAGEYTPMAPTEGKGMPVSFEDGGLKSMTFQDQYTKDGAYALGMHDYILMPVITVICLFVLGLLLYVGARFRRKANPEASRTTHNTMIEVVWTLAPVIILIGIAIPSITLLARQYETPPADAITIKATGYQWYWGYEYPDHDVEVISNMLSDADAIANGEPAKLAVDNRMVVPVGVPLRIQTTGADVIHSFAVPALWFKQDAVPGRLNERMLVIEEPGVYYGQCSELCGARHAYMPISVEAVPMADFEKWVAAQGGTLPGAADEAGAASADDGAAAAGDDAADAAEANGENADADIPAA